MKAMKVLTHKKYLDHIPSSFVYEVVCIDGRFSKPIVVFTVKYAAYQFIRTILEEYKYCEKVIKKTL